MKNQEKTYDTRYSDKKCGVCCAHATYPAQRKQKVHEGEKKTDSSVTFSLAVLCLLAVALCFTGQIGKFVRDGLIICARTIIPTVFPFTVFCALLCALSPFSRIPVFARVFCRLFHISEGGSDAFFLGLLCGFPLGARGAKDAWKAGRISKEEAARLIGFANNTSPAFLLGAVGIGMRADVRDGIALVLATMLSAVAVGILSGIGKPPASYTPPQNQKPFSFSEAIQQAAISTLYVCAFVTFFSVMGGCIISVCGDILPAFILPFLEIGNASFFLSQVALPRGLTLCLTAFASGSAGLCVYAQTAGILSAEICMRQYRREKLFQGFLCLLAVCPIRAAMNLISLG